MDCTTPHLAPHRAENVRRRVNGLRNITLKQYALDQEYHEELEKLKLKYNDLAKTFYEKRRQIVLGQHEPTEQECTIEEERDEKGNSEGLWTDFLEPADHADPSIRGVPDFWLTVLSRAEETSHMIHEHDVPALRALTDITITPVGTVGKPGYGFRVNFEFAANEFFTNTSLHRTFVFATDKYNPGFLFDASEGCKINWAAGKDLTKETVQKKQRNKKTKAVRVVTEQVVRPSFFDFFTPLDLETIVQDAPEDADLDELEELVSLGFEVGEAFREKIVPRAVFIYTGEAGEKECGDDYDQDQGEYDDEDNDEDDENENDNDDNDDSELEEGVERPTKKMTSSAHGAPAAGQECKTQ